ncbi:hypothetical protein FYM97_08965 [Lactobacillus salivarius]|jgi:hypothetical protein|uniref:hypothetical protein n=1 Tax=Ligilactobacillus salivarius TaxID=1624 RepID=UPI00136FB768|nr:hypothetical protein [Ligilactobacillus salivarius]UVX35079.1 MAG: hypothetical protein [Bacteriophage sp.]DAY67743.1 MAG TPA: hypothetical protein [Caudoviricetes sp.]MYU71982.1 hypothetical protein [Ligilactobacillus salivarius]MYY87889.1 hypothetical protein [Ligilactobacillus salivarius]MYZ70833.1 hypothetical protein [Ligilactobacillus salivarius]
MTLGELITLKTDISAYKILLFQGGVPVDLGKENFEAWLPKLEAAQEKLSSFILENEGKDIIF